MSTIELKKMTKKGYLLITIFFVTIILPGVALITLGVTKIYEMPQNIVSATNSHYFYQDEVHTIFYIKATTVGAFIADTPLNVSITTNRMDAMAVQLEFLGASKYFPNHTRPIMPTPIAIWSEENIQEYRDAIDAYHAEYEKQNENLGSNILHLQNDTDIFYTLPFENTTIPNYPNFSGVFENLSYPIGGKFGIGVTITLSNGNVVGYGIGNTNYVIKDYIEVAPLETRYQIQNNYIMTGLGWIGIGITILLSGVALIIELNPFSDSKNKEVIKKLDEIKLVVVELKEKILNQKK